jgi:hypothetical protein
MAISLNQPESRYIARIVNPGGLFLKVYVNLGFEKVT